MAQDTSKTSIHGSYVSKFSNGNTHEKGIYKYGVKHGIWFEYDEKGLLMKKEKWKNGDLIWQLFYEDGKLRRSIDKKGNIKERPACGC